MRAVVVGGGTWGTAFARLLADRGHETTLACRDPGQARAIAEARRNPRYLTTVDLNGIEASTIDGLDYDSAELVVVAVPSRAFAEVVAALPGNCPLLSLTKGLDPETGRRLSTLVEGRPVAVLSGPNFAEEVAEGLPAAAVIALAAGGVDGLGLGDNAKAALITRGLAEMARLGEACGARQETFAGLAGMGDLIVTCWSRHGRNRHAGELIAQGASADDAIAEIGMVVEGLTTAPVLRDLSHRLGIELPITEGVCRILEGESLGDLVL